MEKRFNITGNCFSDRHYMADVSKKLAQTIKMIDFGDYFIINRPRQYGKTTTLYTLTDILQKRGDYFVINTSFEGVGDLFFSEEKRFAQSFVNLLAREIKYHSLDLSDWVKEKKAGIDDLDDLSDVITELVEKMGKKCVLMIDEVDKSSNNQLFVSFLAMLRNKYLSRTKAKTTPR
jgi:predicted AAA+ superfamily ATPase